VLVAVALTLSPTARALEVQVNVGLSPLAPVAVIIVSSNSWPSP
jgi:hypothetical protein